MARHLHVHVHDLNGPTTAPKVHRGVYYWATYELAKQFAQNNGIPTDRIIQYQRGWAVQLRVSGPYAGPSN